MPKYRLSRPAFLNNIWFDKDAEVDYVGIPSVYWIPLDDEADGLMATEVARLKKLNGGIGDYGIGPYGQPCKPPNW
jgi:hypothetical protein